MNEITILLWRFDYELQIKIMENVLLYTSETSIEVFNKM